MAIGSGLAASIAYRAETGSYGTYIAPNSFLRARSASIEKTATRVQGEGIASGAHMPLTAHYVETVTGASANITFDVQSRGMGTLLLPLFGASTTAQQGGTTAYLHTLTVSDPVGKYLTVQAGVPYRGGTVLPHTLTGGKVTKFDLSVSVDGIAEGSVDIDGKAFTTTQSLAAPSYTSTNVFHGGQLNVKAGTWSSETAVTGVRAVNISVSRGLDTEDYTAGQTGTKSEPVLNAYTEITGTITADWLAVATFQTLAHGTTATSLVVELVGPIISSTYAETFRFKIPGVLFKPSTQGWDGPSELTNEWSFKAAYDGTNVPALEIISAETTI